jgi:hypothetical protein
LPIRKYDTRREDIRSPATTGQQGDTSSHGIWHYPRVVKGDSMNKQQEKKLLSLLTRNMKKLEKLKKRVDTQKRYPEEYRYLD